MPRAACNHKKRAMEHLFPSPADWTMGTRNAGGRVEKGADLRFPANRVADFFSFAGA